MAWAELQIPMPPEDIDPNLHAWLSNLITHLRNYLGAYHDRGDPAAADFDQSDLTMDNSWYDLDLSSIIGQNSTSVRMEVRVTDAAVATALSFRKNGNSNIIAQTSVPTQVANVQNRGTLECACDSNRIIEYKATQAIDAAEIRILGWHK